MAAPRIKVDETKLRRKMQQYERIVGKEVRQLVHNSARLCCVQLVKFTQPYGVDSKSKKQGEKKISKNLSGIFTLVNPKWWREVLKMRKNNRESLVNEKTNVAWVRADQTTVSSLAEAKSWHKSRRGSDGQAKQVGPLNRAIIKQSIYRKIVRETEKKVGLVKAGWGVAATLCKADVRQPLSGIPAWVRRNISRASGSVDDRRDSGLGWKIKLKNQVGYARQTLSRTNENIAVQVSRQRMLSMMNHAIRYVKAKEAGLR
jgi:Ni,Fe-hydrogenase I large subunit